jgi:Lrp/AsnC family leucine-responsive transcriptional regulator
MKLDATDIEILTILQEDCKLTNKELSGKLNLSVTAVYERIKKLEREGFIQNYVALLDTEKLNRNFIVLCHVRLERHSREFWGKFEQDVLQLAEVTECLHISGDYDYILKVRVKDMVAFRDFLGEKLTILDHIGNTHSTFVINEVKTTTAIPV